MSTDASVIIRPGRLDDVPMLLALIKGLAEYERLSDQVIATEDDLRRWLFGARPIAETLVACRTAADRRVTDHRSDEPVGFALFFHNFSTFLGRPGLYLEDLFVVPQWRGRGIGRQLLQSLAVVAAERGCGRLEWSVLDWNTPAIGFYRRLGAVVMEDWRICRVTGDALAALAHQ